MALHRWTIYNPVTEETLTLPINPKETLAPAREKKVSANSSTNGNPVIFEGRQMVPTVRCSGSLLRQEDHEFYDAWYEVEHELLVTDHLGRQFWAYMTKFAPTFRNTTRYKWSATYDAEFIFLRWEVRYP